LLAFLEIHIINTNVNYLRNRGDKIMWEILTSLAAVITTLNIVHERLEQPAPKGTRFDTDTYWDDVNRGVDPIEVVRKRQNNQYVTTAPKPVSHRDIPINAIVDRERYEHDVKKYGQGFAVNVNEFFYHVTF
jgi:hypothetical protein